ncbi:hypothetical protein LSAT2_022529, partial [Lamellibrachia satsuma]
VIIVVTCTVIALTVRGTHGTPLNDAASETDDSSVDDTDKRCSVGCEEEAKKCYNACANEKWTRIFCHGQCTFGEVSCHSGCAFERR